MASSAAVAAKTQLSESLLKADGCSHHETLAKASQIEQRFNEVEAQLLELNTMAARKSSGRGCVTALKFFAGAEAALDSLSELGSVDPEIVELHGSTAADSPELQASPQELALLASLQSHILPPDKHADLLRFFDDIEVGQFNVTALLLLKRAFDCYQHHNSSFAVSLLRAQIPRKLLYRASYDGFEPKNWMAQCAGKGPTMTLVKVRPPRLRIAIACELSRCGMMPDASA